MNKIRQFYTDHQDKDPSKPKITVQQYNDPNSVVPENPKT